VYRWTDYLQHRAASGGLDRALIEHILRYSDERYFDTFTRRRVAVGRHRNRLVMVAYEQDDSTITPVTVHATTRQQLNFRLRTRRFTML
jgi:hypothetical protein